MIDRAYMKYEAKQSMKGRKPPVYLVGLFFLVVANILSELSTKIQLGDASYEKFWEDISQGIASFEKIWEISQETAFAAPELSVWGSLILVAVSAMSAVLTVGFQNFCLRVGRRQKAGIGEIFDVFAIFFKVFALNFMMGLFIMLWGFLFVIPGIIASYRYSMAPFILLDNPEKGVMQCIRESKAMTQGYKWELFVLDLSFIGWAFIASIPSGFAVFSPLLAFAGTILIGAFVTPYRNITYSMYYNRLSGWRVEADIITE